MKSLNQLIPDMLNDLAADLTRTAHEIVDAAPVRKGTLRGSVAVGVNSEPSFTGQPDPTGTATKSEISSALRELKSTDQVQLAVTAPYAGWVEVQQPFVAPQLENTGKRS